MISIKAVHESSSIKGDSHVSCVKYRNLNNIAHYHSDYELVYVNEGCATVVINGSSFNLNKGGCVFVSSSNVHHIHSDKTAVVTVLKAERRYFKRLFASFVFQSPVIEHPSDIDCVLSEIKAELCSYDDNSNMMADSIVTQLFINLLRKELTVSRESEIFHKPNNTRLYNEISLKISNEFSTVTFEEMAEYMHFSGPYFSKVFHGIFGMTFTQYLNTVKIATAIEKLKNGNMSVTEIASDCGFNTIRNFNRVFKKYTGYSPNNLPSNYVFLYSLKDGYGLDPTLNCTEIIE